MNNDNFDQLPRDYNPPGLLSRAVIAMDGEIATIEEIWDVKAPGCPLLVFKPYTMFEPAEDVTHVTRRVKAHKQALSKR